VTPFRREEILAVEALEYYPPLVLVDLKQVLGRLVSPCGLLGGAGELIEDPCDTA